MNSFSILKEKSKSQRPGVVPGHTQKEAPQAHMDPPQVLAALQSSFRALLYSLELDCRGEILC